MNIRAITIKIVLCIGVLLTGCNDDLKENPYSFIGPGQVGDSEAAADQWVTGVYSKLPDDMFRWDNFPRVLELDCDYTSGPDWAFSNLGAGNFQGDEVTNIIWKGGYSLINRANVAIKYVSGMNNITQEYKNNALGELYFLKAFTYFMMVKAYGDIPLFDTAISEGTDHNQPRRPIAEVYQEIIRLLIFAKDSMYKNTNGGFREEHVSAGAAAGLLVKVYATMASGALPVGEQIIVKGGKPFVMNGDEMVYTSPIPLTFTKKQVKGYETFDSSSYYKLAADLARDIINGQYGSYSLLPYSSLWKRSSFNKTEHMFMLQAVVGDEKYGNHIFRWFSGVRNSVGVIQTGRWIGNRDHWYKLFDSADLRIVEGVSHRWQMNYQVDQGLGFYYPNNQQYTIMAQGERDASGNIIAEPVAPYNDGLSYINNRGSECLAFTTKFDDVTDKTSARSDAFYPFLRYADVLLLYAEALTELSGNVSQEAINTLNLVRARANATLATTSGDGAITSKIALRSAILEERAKELALEGDRRWDLIRWGIYLDVMNSIEGSDEAGVNKVRDERHLLYPIPQDEIISNKHINENNPGWN